MKLIRGFMCLLALACLFSLTSTAQDGSKKKNDQVKIESNQIELIEVSETVSVCPNQKGTMLRLKVTSEKAIDVRIHSQNLRGRWSANVISGKNRGVEISSFTCLINGKFKVETRPASDKSWF